MTYIERGLEPRIPRAFPVAIPAGALAYSFTAQRVRYQ